MRGDLTSCIVRCSSVNVSGELFNTWCKDLTSNDQAQISRNSRKASRGYSCGPVQARAATAKRGGPGSAIRCLQDDSVQSHARVAIARNHYPTGWFWTFVSQISNSGNYVFGLLIPELGQTEIFEAICKGMMEAPQAAHHSLLWGNTGVTTDKEKETVAEQLCRHYIAQKVSGVFFAPVEFSPGRHEANHRILAALDKAESRRASGPVS